MTRVTVLHSLPTWLPLTATWLHALIVNQPEDIACHVACDVRDDRGAFPVANLHCQRDEHPFRYVMDKVLRRSRLRRRSSHLAAIARTSSADIVHSHWGDVAWRDLPSVRQSGCRHVVTFYGKDVNYLPNRFPIWRERYRELFASVDAILCEGPHMGRCIAALGCDARKIIVNSLGIDLERIHYQARSWKPGEELRFLIAASFREKKGIPDGLAAIATACRGMAFSITVIGDASGDPRSQPEKLLIQRTISENGLDSRVRLLGYQPYEVLLREAYAHHIFVSPSITAADGDTEGGAPVTLIEMAASGMPVLSTTHCDIPHVIDHPLGGLLAPERNRAALAENLRAYISRPQDWPGLTAHARRRIEGEFEIRRQSRRVAEVYRGLVAPANTPVAR